jgi:hypothetical protein
MGSDVLFGHVGHVRLGTDTVRHIEDQPVMGMQLGIAVFVVSEGSAMRCHALCIGSSQVSPSAKTRRRPPCVT